MGLDVQIVSCALLAYRNCIGSSSSRRLSSFSVSLLDPFPEPAVAVDAVDDGPPMKFELECIRDSESRLRCRSRCFWGMLLLFDGLQDAGKPLIKGGLTVMASPVEADADEAPLDISANLTIGNVFHDRSCTSCGTFHR
jgi:hypothetical protein